jgi:serine/threonine protein kinase
MYDIFVVPDCIYTVLEFCPGGSLYPFTHPTRLLSGRQLHGVCKTILTGLVYIHAHQFAHLDLKPSNILVDRFGRPKLADFGFARGYTAEMLEHKQHAGTLAYVAPEVITSGPYDPFKADIWSFGMTCYVLACGKGPWEIKRARDILEGITQRGLDFPDSCDSTLAEAIRRMLVLDPRQRPTAAECMEFQVFIDADIKDGKLPVDTAAPKKVKGPGKKPPYATALVT